MCSWSISEWSILSWSVLWPATAAAEWSPPWSSWSCPPPISVISPAEYIPANKVVSKTILGYR